MLQIYAKPLYYNSVKIPVLLRVFTHFLFHQNIIEVYFLRRSLISSSMSGQSVRPMIGSSIITPPFGLFHSIDDFYHNSLVLTMVVYLNNIANHYGLAVQIGHFEF